MTKSAAQPDTSRRGQPLPPWQAGEYQVHFIHTGVGEAIFHIFPDGTTMLVDCGDQPAITRMELSVPVVPGPQRLAGEWATRYVQRVLPQDHPVLNGLPLIDYLLLTHYHDDHCGSGMWQTITEHTSPLPGCFRSGMELAAEQLAFRTAIDRCWPDFNDRQPNHTCYREVEHMKRLYPALAKRDGTTIEKFRLGATDQITPQRHPEAAKDFAITNIAANGRIIGRDGNIRDLYCGYDGPAPNENGMSLGFIARYGDFSLYCAGDFSDSVRQPDGTRADLEELSAPDMPRVEVAKANHHGHYSMPTALAQALAPQAYVFNVWTQRQAVTPVLERLAAPGIAPQGVTFFPTVFPTMQLEAAQGQPYLENVAPETIGQGVHVVLTVPPGGAEYRISCVNASDEQMAIAGEYHFRTRRP